MTARRTIAGCSRSLAVLAGAVVAFGLFAASASIVHAQAANESTGDSYITPFPGGERYKLRVIGDELGEGILGALNEALASDPRLDVEKKVARLSGLARANSIEELKQIAEAAARDKPNIVVVMFGIMDRWSYRTPDGRRHPVGTPEWRTVFTQRIDELLRNLKSAGVAVYWVGLPIMRRPEMNEAVQVQNDVYRERTYLAGVRYIDVYQSFADEQGEYSPYGPDLAGKNSLLRDADGMHMTDAGYQKLAHFVEKELKRDLTQAKNERTIPLAGSEAEQALINPVKEAAKSPNAGAGWNAQTSTSNSAAASSPGTSGGDQPADTGKINLKTSANDGREQVVAIELLRPAIPAAVLALVTRRESTEQASQMGDQVIDQIPGGITVMSSITPAGDQGASARRKISPAQAPYFRVLVKGERIASRPGRADDNSWPLPEPAKPEAVEENKVEPNAAPAAPAVPPRPPAAAPPPAVKPKR